MKKFEEKYDDSIFRTKVVSAFRWNAIGRFSGQLITWVITLFVIRLLKPSDYGLMSMASVFIAFMTLLNELGLGAAIIQAKNIEIRILQKIFGLVIIVNLLLFAILFIGSPLIAMFFDENRLIMIIRVLSIQFLFISFNVIPQSILERELEFKKRSVIELIANIFGSFTTLWLAIMGKGVWALVFGSLVISLIRTVGLNAFSPIFVRPIFSLIGIKKEASFGGFIISERLLWYFYSQVDSLIVGKTLGKELLGFYSVGKHIASLPSQKISPVINQVIFPAFSRIQDQAERVKENFLKGISFVGIIAFPIFFGISSISDEFVRLILGVKWLHASISIKWISLVLPLGMMSAIMLSVLRSLGRADICLKNIFIGSVLMTVAFLIGSKYAILGVSLAWFFGYPLYFLFALLLSAPIINFKQNEFIISISKPFFSSLTMYFLIYILREIFGRHIPLAIMFGFMIIFGSAIYIGLQARFNKENINDLISYLKK